MSTMDNTAKKVQELIGELTETKKNKPHICSEAEFKTIVAAMAKQDREIAADIRAVFDDSKRTLSTKYKEITGHVLKKKEDFVACARATAKLAGKKSKLLRFLIKGGQEEKLIVKCDTHLQLVVLAAEYPQCGEHIRDLIIYIKKNSFIEVDEEADDTEGHEGEKEK